MINFVTDHKVPVKTFTQVLLPLNPQSQAFKGQLNKDVFTPSAPAQQPAFGGIFDWEIFSVPRVLRKNPALKQLAKEAMNGDVASYNTLIVSDKIAPKKLDEVKTYVITNLLDNCCNKPSSRLASAVVEMKMVPDLTTNMLHSRGRIESLKELPTMAKGLGWVQVYGSLKDTVITNQKVLNTVLDSSNPKAPQGQKQFAQAIYDFLSKMDPDRDKNNTSKYAKIYALDLLKEKGNSVTDIEVVKAVANNPEQLEEVREKAIEVLPELISR